MNRIIAILLVLMIMLTGCVSDNKKENAAASDVSVSDTEYTEAPGQEPPHSESSDVVTADGADIDEGGDED